MKKILQQKNVTNHYNVSSDTANVLSDNITMKTIEQKNHQGQTRCHGFNRHCGTSD
jgi:hypothetical protein